MRIHLLALGTRRPGWEREGYEHYARRLPPQCRLELTEIPIEKRTRSTSVNTLLAREGQRMLRLIPRDAFCIALDESGKRRTTRELADALAGWLQGGRDIAMLIGGPDGLARECLCTADERWSLSPLTLPHGLCRIVLAEQLYRAWSLLQGHPYHRD